LLDVRYVSATALAGELCPDAPRGARAAALAVYAAADLVLLDDAHELADQACQREVFQLVSALLSADKQLVVTAAVSPRSMVGLDDRLRSHFQMGLVADLGAPGYETRLAILRAKAAARGATLPAASLEQLARRISGSVRELEGALNRVLAAAELSGAPLTIDGVAAALASFSGVAGAARVRPSAAHIVRAVAQTFGVSTDSLTGKRRDKEIVLPRHVAMYLIRETTGASLSEVGMILGGRDHTTVLHGCEKVSALLAADDTLHGHIEATRHLAAELAGAEAAGRAAAAAAAP
jgi:chromosomal replication initiator protein